MLVFEVFEFLLGLNKICQIKNVQNITPRLIANKKQHYPVQSPSRGSHEVFVNALGWIPDPETSGILFVVSMFLVEFKSYTHEN